MHIVPRPLVRLRIVEPALAAVLRMVSVWASRLAREDGRRP